MYGRSSFLYDRCVQYKHGAHRSDAEELVAKYPVIEVDGTVALCDGGEGERRSIVDDVGWCSICSGPTA
eukprot:43796-Eustigmatos_ZCMA.PRE.1